MGDITREKVRGYRARRKRAQRYTAAFLAFATLVGCGVGWSLRQTGISATAEAFCGAEEHTHTQQCYEKVLICGLEEGETLPTEAPHEHTDSCYEEKLVAACAQEEHTHTDGCYAMQRNLTCTAQEHSHTDACYTLTGGSLVCAAQEHTHSDACKDAEGNIVCGLSEHTHGDGCYSPVEKVLSCTLQEHTHGDSCYGPAQKTLICGHAEHTHTAECMKNEKVLVCTLPTQQEPQEPHVHTDACYEEKLICGKTEHTHSELCFSNTAARETEEQWAAAAGNPGSGIWAIDLLGVASSQLGYEEVKENFILDENGAKKFYTRYGDSYGDPYGSWNGMFLAYCLKYAGVPEVVVPRRAGVAALLADMASSAHLKNPGEYDPQPGDIAVFGDRVGVIGESGDPLTVICGNVDGKVAEIQVAAASVSKYIQVAVAAASMSKCFQVAVAGAGGNQNDETLEGDTLTTVDLSGYTTSVKLTYGNPSQETEIREGSSPEITLSDGDAVKIFINYAFPAGTKTSNATYDLPTEIKTTSEVTGKVLNDSGTVVGSFTIENSKINITYNENAWEGESTHTGYVFFEGNVDLSDTNDKKEITFPGAGKITIDKKEEPKDYGHRLEKTVVKTEDGKTLQVQEDGSVKVTYKVTLTATGADGSGVDNLTITDILNRTRWNTGNDYLNASYDQSSFELVKSGSDEDFLNKGGTTLTFDTDSEGHPRAKIENIPALGAKDETYTLTYDVIVPAEEFKGNDVKSVKNWVNTDDNHIAENAEARKEYKLQKGSSYNSGTGRITWTVTVNNPLGPVDGYKVWDELPENLKGKVTGDITITDCNWQTVKTLTKGSTEFNNFFSETGYTFGTDKNNPPYRFTYETEAPNIPDGQTEATAINTARVTPKDEDTITVTKEEKVDSGKWTTQKKQESVSGDMVYWSIQAENTLGSKYFTVTDTIKDASTNAWNATFYPGTHYALESELEKAFKGVYSTDGKGLYVLLDDGPGKPKEVAYGSQQDDVTFTISYTKASETDAVTAFTIEVTSTNKKVKGIYLSAYPTHVDFTETPDGSTWIFKNDLMVDKEQTSAAYSYTKLTDFKKEVSMDYGTTWSSENGVTEDVTLESVKYGILYHVVLSIEAGHSGNIVITDKLPDGTKFINIDNFLIDGSNGWWLNGQPVYDETKNTVTFTITPQQPEKAHTIEVRYKVDVANDPDWENTLIGSKNYRNVASWGNEEAETNTLVKRYNSTLAKEAEQLKDSNGEASNRIQYTVVINPNKEDLANGADSFTLEDTLTLGSVTGNLDPSSFQLYYYKDVGGTLDLTNKAQIIKLDWAASNPYHFAVTVPNRTALVLRYIFEVNMSSVPAGTTTFDISNVAKIGTNTSASKRISIADQKAGGGFNGDKLQLIKKDKDSGLLISGAQFSIRSYDKDSRSWTAVWEGEIPDGQIDFGISKTPSATTTVLQPGVLYSIQETKAPDNYKLDTTPRYVIFSSDTDIANVFQTAAGGDSITGTNTDTVTVSNVTFLAKSGASTLEFENQYTHLDVKKEWRDKNDNLIEAPVDSIKVQLKRYPIGHPDKKENVGTPVTLNKTSNWSYSWTDLEQGYYYTVEEVLPEDWKVWTVSYVHNDGIQTGQIYITNVVSDEFTYELPRTGGSGTKNFVLFGAFAMILAGCGMVVTRKKHDTGVYER